jgi:predicted MFS family arabinose efflux permease
MTAAGSDRLTRDGRRILAAQAIRAAAYGFGAVQLGVVLASRGWSSGQLGGLLAAMVAGTALASLAVGVLADRVGRRRSYAALFAGLAVSGLVLGLATQPWALVAVALLGTLSTEVVESGPFTSLEQAMLPDTVPATERTRMFGVYNAVATVAGSLWALAAGGPALLRQAGLGVPTEQRLLLVLVPVGLAGLGLAWSLSPAVELARQVGRSPLRRPLGRSRAVVTRLSVLFAVDAFGGGFVVQTFIAYWLAARYGAPVELLGLVFLLVGLLQAASFLAAVRLARRVGLLATMVGTHLPSNLLLAAIPLAPTLPVALALLLGRSALAQMDVPTRQAYVVALVAPEERTAAAAATNTARYLARPLAPALAGAAGQLTGGLPFLLAGGIKTAYDLALWAWFRRVPLPTERPQPGSRRPAGADRLSLPAEQVKEPR